MGKRVNIALAVLAVALVGVVDWRMAQPALPALVAGSNHIFLLASGGLTFGSAYFTSLLSCRVERESNTLVPCIT